MIPHPQIADCDRVLVYYPFLPGSRGETTARRVALELRLLCVLADRIVIPPAHVLRSELSPGLQRDVADLFASGTTPLSNWSTHSNPHDFVLAHADEIRELKGTSGQESMEFALRVFASAKERLARDVIRQRACFKSLLMTLLDASDGNEPSSRTGLTGMVGTIPTGAFSRAGVAALSAALITSDRIRLTTNAKFAYRLAGGVATGAFVYLRQNNAERPINSPVTLSHSILLPVLLAGEHCGLSPEVFLNTPLREVHDRCDSQLSRLFRSAFWKAYWIGDGNREAGEQEVLKAWRRERASQLRRHERMKRWSSMCRRLAFGLALTAVHQGSTHVWKVLATACGTCAAVVHPQYSWARFHEVLDCALEPLASLENILRPLRATKSGMSAAAGQRGSVCT